jgi:hypothetical protein
MNFKQKHYLNLNDENNENEDNKKKVRRDKHSNSPPVKRIRVDDSDVVLFHLTQKGKDNPVPKFEIDKLPKKVKKSLILISQDQSSSVTSQNQSSSVTSQNQSSSVISQNQSPSVTSQNQSSSVTSQNQFISQNQPQEIISQYPKHISSPFIRIEKFISFFKRKFKFFGVLFFFFFIVTLETIVVLENSAVKEERLKRR